MVVQEVVLLELMDKIQPIPFMELILILELEEKEVPKPREV